MNIINNDYILYADYNVYNVTLNQIFRYEKLLKQARMENEDEIRKRQDEIVALKTTIKNQGERWICLLGTCSIRFMRMLLYNTLLLLCCSLHNFIYVRHD